MNSFEIKFIRVTFSMLKWKTKKYRNKINEFKSNIVQPNYSTLLRFMCAKLFFIYYVCKSIFFYHFVVCKEKICEDHSNKFSELYLFILCYVSLR